MSMRKRSLNRGLIAGLLSAAALAAVVQAAAGPGIDWLAFTGGGGRSTGPGIVLESAVGQPAVGRTTGGGIELDAGYLAARFETRLYLPLARK